MLKNLHSDTARIFDNSLVPHIGSQPVTFKKVDIAVSFSDEGDKAKQVLKKVWSKHPMVPLCQTDDPRIAYLPQLLAIEVKPHDGSYCESSLQLGIWMAAGLERICQLRTLASQRPPSIGTEQQSGHIPPLVGVTVVGHVWSLHLTSKDETGLVVSMQFSLHLPKTHLMLRLHCTLLGRSYTGRILLEIQHHAVEPFECSVFCRRYVDGVKERTLSGSTRCCSNPWPLTVKKKRDLSRMIQPKVESGEGFTENDITRCILSRIASSSMNVRCLRDPSKARQADASTGFQTATS